MRLLQWNIQWCRGMDGRVDPERIARLARELADPDVICLQEIARNFPEMAGSSGEDQVEELLKHLKGYEAFFAPGVDIPGKRGRRQFGNMILTRLPAGRAIPPLDAAQLRAGLRRSVAWFPLVGGLVGCIGAVVMAAAGMLWPRPVAVVLLLVVEARLTGAFHEDAVADFCDGLGGGTTAQRIREIMKDSRIGSYGALGLILAVALRAALLIALPAGLLLPALIASAAFGRWVAVAAMVAIPPLDQPGSLAREVGQRPGPAILCGASLLFLPFFFPFAWLAPGQALAATAAALLFLLWFRRMLMSRLGGVTGDCLGFAVYAGQLLLLLAGAMLSPVG